MKTDKEILQEHLAELIKTKRDGDPVVHALKDILYIMDDKLWISTNIDLMIAVRDGNVSIYEKGMEIDKIKSARFEYNIGEVSSLDIEQNI